MKLSSAEGRVLGSLIEKEIATPENYPLSLNAIQAACNQRSSRDPVTELGEEELRQALHRLEELDLVGSVHDARVVKWEHRARSAFQLRRDEIAVLCLLLLRGPQTPGELRSRTDRLYSFTDLDSVVNTLERLAVEPAAVDAGEPAGNDAPAVTRDAPTRPLVAILPRQPGAREARYRHLLGGEAVPEGTVAPQERHAAAPIPVPLPPSETALEQIETKLRELEARVARIEEEQAALRKSVGGLLT